MDVTFLVETPLLALLFLMGSGALSGVSIALQKMGRLQAEEEFKKGPLLFFYRSLLPKLFGERKWEGLSFLITFTKQLVHLCYAFTAFFFLIFQEPFSNVFKTLEQRGNPLDPLWVMAIALLTISFSLIVNFALSIVGSAKPLLLLRTLSPFASFFLILCAPVSVPLCKFLQNVTKTPMRGSPPAFPLREKVLEILDESDIGRYLDLSEEKFILSVISFRERIVREVMVPRIDVFSLPIDTTIRQASQTLLSERYSRIPVYKESVDNIVGLLHYKDLFDSCARTFDQKQFSDHLDSSVEKLIKPVLYTPETKKISHLLQEFRSKQMHLAIVVDEYGGTEGIVTIEDILEELVGEISDEYDSDEEVLFSLIPGGGWIVDAKMSIIDIEEDLGIKIPHSHEYDTIGGFIFHRAGAIPSAGWRIHHDDFDLEVLSSSERLIEKIRITPHQTK
jgi:putative hemolysin